QLSDRRNRIRPGRSAENLRCAAENPLLLNKCKGLHPARGRLQTFFSLPIYMFVFVGTNMYIQVCFLPIKLYGNTYLYDFFDQI
ncbi:MAG: hypothetical protein IIX10_04575, partial [Clostridia bacterium]|nr:hypothetical protein [Clostridia bacterium]